MRRHYFISNNLDDLDRVEQQLESRGIVRPQIHVLSHDDAGIESHTYLHGVEAVLKYDVVHGTIAGAVIGALLALCALLVAGYSGMVDSYTWTPFIFLAVVLFGFSTWFGGYHGIKQPHRDLARFEKVLSEGRHVLFVDIDPAQVSILKDVVSEHPNLADAGTGQSTPRWVVMAQHRATDIFTHTFP